MSSITCSNFRAGIASSGRTEEATPTMIDRPVYTAALAATSQPFTAASSCRARDPVSAQQRSAAGRFGRCFPAGPTSRLCMPPAGTRSVREGTGPWELSPYRRRIPHRWRRRGHRRRCGPCPHPHRRSGTAEEGYAGPSPRRTALFSPADPGDAPQQTSHALLLIRTLCRSGGAIRMVQPRARRRRRPGGLWRSSGAGPGVAP